MSSCSLFLRSTVDWVRGWWEEAFCRSRIISAALGTAGTCCQVVSDGNAVSNSNSAAVQTHQAVFRVVCHACRLKQPSL